MKIAKSVTRNTFWNIVGQVLPVAAAILAVPLLIARLGQDRFGVLTMVWVVVGYSGLFDFGVGRGRARFGTCAGSSRPGVDFAGFDVRAGRCWRWRHSPRQPLVRPSSDAYSRRPEPGNDPGVEGPGGRHPCHHRERRPGRNS